MHDMLGPSDLIFQQYRCCHHQLDVQPHLIKQLEEQQQHHRLEVHSVKQQEEQQHHHRLEVHLIEQQEEQQQHH